MSPVALAYDTSGPEGAEPLLLGGSLGTTRAMWEPQASLSDRYRLIAFDHRGHGGSPAPDGPYSIAELGEDVLALLDALEIERASYCGLSIGGMVGLWLAINAPQRIDRLTLICTGAYLPPRSKWTERASAVREGGGAEAIADTVVGRWFTPAYAAAQPEVVARHRAMIVATPAEGYAACCEAIADHDVREGMPSITAPTLVIAAAQDTSIAPEHGAEIAAAVPGARFELLDPGAHVVSVERADAVTALIREHMEASA